MSVRRTLAAALAAGLLLAGCSDDPEPRFAPTEPSSPSESETTAEPEAQTPEEFIREWNGLQRDMQTSGNTREYLRLSPGCDSCASTADLVEKFYAAGGFVRTEGRTILRIEPVKTNETYDVRVRSAPTEYKEAAEAELQSFPGGVTTYRLTLVKRSGGWRLVDEAEVSDS